MKFLWRISILLMLVITLNPAANAAPGDVKWTYSNGQMGYSDLAISPDGTIYLGHGKVVTEAHPLPGGGSIITSYYTNYLYAITPDGEEKWGHHGIGQNISVRSDGKILGGRVVGTILPGSITPTIPPSSDYKLKGVNPDGTAWFDEFTAGRVAITADDNVIALNLKPAPGGPYHTGIANVALRPENTGWTNRSVSFPYTDDTPIINKDGTILYVSWSLLEPDDVYQILGSGTVIVTNTYFQNSIYGFRPDGTLKYQIKEPDVSYSTPAIGSDGSLFLASAKRKTTTVDSTIEWRFRSLKLTLTEQWSISSPDRFGPAVVDSTNNVYVGTGFKLLCLTSKGIERWSYTAEGEIDLCPALAADGTVYVVTGHNKLLALSAEDGRLLWSYNRGIYSINFPPTIGADGTIYLLFTDVLIALEGTAPPANAPWPQDRHDAQRTSRATQASTSAPTKTGDGKFSLTLNLELGRTYKVEASEDLQTWTEIGSFTSSSSAQTFLDETSAGKSHRFYRLVIP